MTKCNYCGLPAAAFEGDNGLLFRNDTCETGFDESGMAANEALNPDMGAHDD